MENFNIIIVYSFLTGWQFLRYSEGVSQNTWIQGTSKCTDCFVLHVMYTFHEFSFNILSHPVNGQNQQNKK